MVRGRWLAAGAIVNCALILSPARGSMINDLGTLHATASATSGSTSQTNTPPDTFFPPGTGSGIAASASVNGTSGAAFASVNAVVSALAGISIGGNTSINSAAIGSGNFASATASGTVTFTEDGTETVAASVNVSDPLHVSGSWTLKNSSNATVLFGSGSALLTADTYTLTWFFGPIRATGTGGNDSVSYALVPEPTSVALLVTPASLLLLRVRKMRARLSQLRPVGR